MRMKAKTKLRMMAKKEADKMSRRGSEKIRWKTVEREVSGNKEDEDGRNGRSEE